MTPSEIYVANLCEKSFLPFWSFPNPIGKKNKELCDVLIVCENTIIIISVKEIKLSKNKDETINYQRWVKKAILDSVNQIYGAERYLRTVDFVFLKDRKTKIPLPEHEKRKIYRIAIAFGSNDECPIFSTDFGSGYVNVFDENSIHIVLNELDTITDFTNYIFSKENFVTNRQVYFPREIDLLAFYLQTGLESRTAPNVIHCSEKLWETYLKTDEYKEWRNSISESYIWDYMINDLFDIHIKNKSTQPRHEIEESIRLINLEPRINRIVLGELLRDALKKEKVKARMIKPLENSNHSYVFMPFNWQDIELMKGELILRCDVARLENPSAEKVIGIALGVNKYGKIIFEICYVHIPQINQKFKNHVETIKNELGYFKNI